MSKTGFDTFNMPNTAERAVAEENIHHSNYDYSQTYTYSDLEYSYMNANVEAEYKVRENLALTVGVNYYDLQDKQTYVYGDESGGYMVFRTGLRFGLLGW